MLIYFLKNFEKENSDRKNVETADNRQIICKKDEINMQKTRKNMQKNAKMKLRVFCIMIIKTCNI